MAVVQSTYADDYASGFPGMVANGETSNRISRTVEQSGGIGFGKAAYRSSDHGVDTTEAVATFLGFTIANYAAPPVEATGVQADTYPQGSTAGILTMGCMWVSSSIAVNDGEQVYVTSAGVITNVSTSNFAATGWFFQDTIGAAGLVRIAKR
jgi:hypothetical protein